MDLESMDAQNILPSQYFHCFTECFHLIGVDNLNFVQFISEYIEAQTLANLLDLSATLKTTHLSLLLEIFSQCDQGSLEIIQSQFLQIFNHKLCFVWGDLLLSFTLYRDIKRQRERQDFLDFHDLALFQFLPTSLALLYLCYRFTFLSLVT